jgi:uncharacterized damage-inducible protein DinB
VTLDDLAALLDFHYWARDRVLDAAAALTPAQFTHVIVGSFPTVRETLVHMYWADWAWYQLWHGTFPAAPLAVDRFTDLESIRRAWNEHEAGVRAFVTALADGDPHRVVEFTRPDGTAGAFAIAHMIQHLVNHGTYHRGQVTMMLRQLGAEPPQSTDLIRYYRERAAVASGRA